MTARGAEPIGRRPAEEAADAAARTDTPRPTRPLGRRDSPRRVSITGTNVANVSDASVRSTTIA